MPSQLNAQSFHARTSTAARFRSGAGEARSQVFMGVSSTPSTLLAQRNRAANSTLATAKALGTFPPGNRKFRDAIGRGNPSDFFRLEVTENSRIKLFLTNRSSNAITGAILNQRGQVINLNGKRQLITLAANQQSNTLLRSAAPGIYYLRFTSSDTSKTNYEVNLFVNRKGGPAPLPCGCEG